MANPKGLHMIKNTTQKKAMSAVQFSRKMDGIMNVMEGIASKTRESETALFENSDMGVFDMNNLTDVYVPDEEDQPMMNINKPYELTDGDKAQIVEKLAEKFMSMPGEVIELSDIGPIAVAVGTELGFTSIEGFIHDLITGAADKQNSQSFAKGQPVPGVQDADSAMGAAPVNSDKAPTDITPEKAHIADKAQPELGMGAPMAPDMSAPIAPAPVAPEMAAPAPEMIAPEMDAPVAPEFGGEAEFGGEGEGEGDALADLDNIEIDDIDLGEGGETAEDEAVEGEGTESFEDKPEGEETPEEDEEVKEEEVKAKLESIRGEFMSKINNKKLETMVEQITASTKKTDAVLESIAENFHSKMNAKVRTEKVVARLESIVSGMKAEKKLEIQLEAIAAKAKKPAFKGAAPAFTKKAAPIPAPKKGDGVVALPADKTLKGKPMVKGGKPTGAALKESEDVEAKLNALIESYKSTTTSPKARLEAIQARRKAREAMNAAN